jgi:hypothetical protein
MCVMYGRKMFSAGKRGKYAFDYLQLLYTENPYLCICQL